MAVLGLIFLLLIPASMFYCSVYLIELIRTWKYTTTGAKLGQATVSIISAIVLAVVVCVLKN